MVCVIVCGKHKVHKHKPSYSFSYYDSWQFFRFGKSTLEVHSWKRLGSSAVILLSLFSQGYKPQLATHRGAVPCSSGAVPPWRPGAFSTGPEGCSPCDAATRLSSSRSREIRGDAWYRMSRISIWGANSGAPDWRGWGLSKQGMKEILVIGLWRLRTLTFLKCAPFIQSSIKIYFLRSSDFPLLDCKMETFLWM